MFSRYLLLLLSTLIWITDANIIPREPLSASATSDSGTTSTLASPVSISHSQAAASPNPDLLCCFVVQDIVSEEWWDIVATSSIYTEVDETQITAHLTPYPTTTITSYEINVYPTNASLPVTAQVGLNPIPLFSNGAPLPTQVDQSNNGTALVTGGVTVQSPAAFYVYSTVKVIMAAAITDSAGNLACGTSIGGFPNMNQNAQAYFGGPDNTQAPPTPTAFRNRARDPQPDAVVISLTTPFIYQPAQGMTGASWDLNTCTENPGTEDYGYVPQTVLDFLVSNKQYSAQYPGLASCLPGGPSIIPAGCGLTVTTIYSTFTTTAPISTSLSIFTTFGVSNSTIIIPASTVLSVGTIFSTSIFTSVIAESTNTGGVSLLTTGNLTRSITVTATIAPASTLLITTAVPVPITTPEVVEPFILFSPVTTPVVATSAVAVGGSAVVVTSAVTETITGEVPAGAVAPPSYQTTDAGTDITSPPVTIINNPQSAQAPLVTPLGAVQVTSPPGGQQSPQATPPANPIATAVCQIIGGCATAPPANPQVQPSPSGVSVVINQQTTIPLSVAPLGLQGRITTIDGTPMLVASSQTFNPFTPTANTVPGASVTIGPNGSPSIVISSSTLVPLINAPPQLSSAPTTIINNTPFLVVGPTTFAAPTSQVNGFSTTNIGGTNFIVFLSATDIPVSSAPPGLSGSLTIINNTPFIAVPGATSVQVQATQTGHLLTTTINGTPFLVVPSATEIPLSNAPPGLSGITTTINGTPFLVITSATISQLPTSTGQIASVPGLVTVINGVTEVIFTGLATIPVNSEFSLSGLTTVISGITEVILSTPTTVSLQTSPSSSSTGSTLSSTTSTSTSSSRSSTRSSTSSTSSSSSTTSSTTTTSASQTPTVLPSQSSSKKGLSTGAKVGIAFAVIFFALLLAGLFLCWRRRRQGRQQYAPVAPLAPSGDGAPPVVQQAGPLIAHQADPPRMSTQVGAENYTPVVRTRGGYVPAPQEEWLSSLRRERSIARKPVGTG